MAPPLQLRVHMYSPNVREYRVVATPPLWSLVDLLSIAALGATVLFQLVVLQRVAIDWMLIGSALPALGCALSKRAIVREESVLVVHDLGIQLKKTFWSGNEKVTFIDKNQIKDVIINEGITMCQVIYYMAVIVEGKQNMVLAFEHLFPKLNMLTDIYRGVRAVMYSEPEN